MCYKNYVCPCYKFDNDAKCTTPHLTNEEVQTLFISAVNQLFAEKDKVIAEFGLIRDAVLDTSALQAEQSKLQNEILVVSELMQQCIYENAHIALDQEKYQKRYGGLTARFDKAKARLETVSAEISNKQSRQARIEAFLAGLQKQDGLVEKFDLVLWYSLLDFVTVYSRNDIRFTFKDGTRIKA